MARFRERTQEVVSGEAVRWRRQGAMNIGEDTKK